MDCPDVMPLGTNSLGDHLMRQLLQQEQQGYEQVGAPLQAQRMGRLLSESTQ
jgi:hypothetical protein